MDKIVITKEYKRRIIDDKLEQYLDTFGAVCLEGPKWCGKSWTASYHSNSEFLLADPKGNYHNKFLAETSPDIVLEGKTPKLIDEWQLVPPLWDGVRYAVDRRGKTGQFILTGSSTANLTAFTHSGAGRIGRLRMRTMSLYESKDSSGLISLKDICSGKFKDCLTGEVDLNQLAYLTVRGGWAGNLKTKKENVSLIPTSYIDEIVEKLCNQVDDEKHNTVKMKQLLCSLARNECTTASNQKLLDDISKVDGEKIDYDTIYTYMNVFNRLFLFDNQLPYTTNVRSSNRIKKSEKRHFCDPSLACALLKLTPEKLINDLQTFGYLFESLCERDLKVYADSFNANVYHYQDYNGKEIDAVIELDDGKWCAFEIKLGANQIDKAAESLIKIKEYILKNGGNPPSVLCVICGLSNAAYLRPDGVYVVPITALKN